MAENKDEVKDAAPKAEKQVLIYHSGDAHGPMQTPYGVLVPGQSLPVPESYSKKIVGNYKHIKLASDIIPGGTKAAELAASEKVVLQSKIKALEAQLADLSADIETRVSAATSESEGKIKDLEAKLDEFLQAKDKKTLEALQDKHAVAA